MKNLLHLLVLAILSVLCTSCAENETSAPPETFLVAAKDSVSSYGPVSMVRNVRRARNGDMLIASYTGVWRCDGKVFTNITTAIPAPSFWDVLEDQRGDLWFGTKDSGVYRYDGRSYQHFTTRQGLPDNCATHLFEDKAGNIWIAAGEGASRFDGKSHAPGVAGHAFGLGPPRNFTSEDGIPEGGVNTFMEDKAGNIWMGTRTDLCYYDGKTITILKNKAGETFHNVWAIVEDQKGNIWFGGSIIKDKKGSTLILESGLWRYDGSTITKVSERTASAMIEDKNGNLWTAGNGSGTGVLSRYDQKTLYDQNPAVTEIFTNQQMLCGMAEAKDGSIWFGSGKGVYRWDGKATTDFQPKVDQIYTIDTKVSRITWKGSMKLSPEDKHVGYVSVSKGELRMEKNRLVGGDVTIDINSIEYGDKKDPNTPVKHLKSADYFDVKGFPFAALALSKVDSINPNTVHITGYLTIKNASRLVSFPATVEVKNGIISATANLTLDRTQWGITYSSGKFYKMLADEIVSDEMEFVVKVVGRK